MPGFLCFSVFHPRCWCQKKTVKNSPRKLSTYFLISFTIVVRCGNYYHMMTFWNWKTLSGHENSLTRLRPESVDARSKDKVYGEKCCKANYFAVGILSFCVNFFRAWKTYGDYGLIPKRCNLVECPSSDKGNLLFCSVWLGYESDGWRPNDSVENKLRGMELSVGLSKRQLCHLI